MKQWKDQTNDLILSFLLKFKLKRNWYDHGEKQKKEKLKTTTNRKRK